MEGDSAMNLLDAKLGADVIVRDIVSEDEELKSFLFSLGCYSLEAITVVSKKKNGIIVSIKDARYNLDEDLAKAIKICFHPPGGTEICKEKEDQK